MEKRNSALFNAKQTRWILPPPPPPSHLRGEHGPGSHQAAGSEWTCSDPNCQSPIWFLSCILCPAFCLASEIRAQKVPLKLKSHFLQQPQGAPFPLLQAGPPLISANLHRSPPQQSCYRGGGGGGSSHRQRQLEEHCT